MNWGFKGIFILALALGCSPAGASDIATSAPTDQTDLDVSPVSSDAEEPKRHLVSWNHYEGEWFSVRVGGLFMGDVVGFAQDSASVDQVGVLEPKAQIRTVRLTASGQLKFADPWSYIVTGEYVGFDRGSDTTGSHYWQLTELSLTIPISHIGRVTLGKFKEPISIGRLTGSGNITFMERPAVLDALLPSRNTGVELSNTAANDRASWSVGWFNSVFGGTGTSANSVAGRVTGLAIDKRDTLLHLGIAGRWAQAPGGELHYKARPEVYESPYFVDTGGFVATDESDLSLEITWQQGPLFTTAEYLADWVSSSAKGSPFFNGFYVSSAWMLTGERRPYSPAAGYFGAVSPAHPLFAGGWGAMEVAARYSWVDLNDAAIHGGRFGRASLSLNWYATDNLRLEFNYGYGRLARSGLDGGTHFFQARIQFVI